MENNTFVDQLGRSIRIPKKPIRIVSLVPSQTELLAYFGLDSEVVGVTKFCIHPKEWFNKKIRIGGTKNVDIQKIKDLKPDLIIGNKEEITLQLKNAVLGLQQIILEQIEPDEGIKE
jgi:ABC-type Fe3+-hydroxamate transport system substrate-binding protein